MISLRGRSERDLTRGREVVPRRLRDQHNVVVRNTLTDARKKRRELGLVMVAAAAAVRASFPPSSAAASPQPSHRVAALHTSTLAIFNTVYASLPESFLYIFLVIFH